MRASMIVLFVIGVALPAGAQTLSPVPPSAREVNLSGPRVGFTTLSDGIIQKLQEERNITVKPYISQFGWQFERQFYGKQGGVAAVNEFVVLLGGLDQGVAIPSVSWLVGIRNSGGAEFGVGPNVTPAGVALAFAAGVTFRSGILNVPMNIAVVPSKAGMRVSMLTGFSLRR
jgi:hypothetical protein